MLSPPTVIPFFLTDRSTVVDRYSIKTAMLVRLRAIAWCANIGHHTYYVMPSSKKDGSGKSFCIYKYKTDPLRYIIFSFNTLVGKDRSSVQKNSADMFAGYMVLQWVINGRCFGC